MSFLAWKYIAYGHHYQQNDFIIGFSLRSVKTLLLAAETTETKARTVVVSMCLPSTFSQKHKHCFQTILLLRLLLRLLFGEVLLYWIMCLVFFTIYKPFAPFKNYELVMHPCL